MSQCGDTQGVLQGYGYCPQLCRSNFPSICPHKVVFGCSSPGSRGPESICGGNPGEGSYDMSQMRGILEYSPDCGELESGSHYVQPRSRMDEYVPDPSVQHYEKLLNEGLSAHAWCHKVPDKDKASKEKEVSSASKMDRPPRRRPLPTYNQRSKNRL